MAISPAVAYRAAFSITLHSHDFVRGFVLMYITLVRQLCVINDQACGHWSI